ncbi:MAG TPA: dihydrofolate reductase family protein [Candidatus Saccharimonadales bacterium]|nr:dihydrofolate reductase family protein [Candidatus Saccharimonadales bacterium]
MRKIIVQSFVSLDGVMQAPGGPEEDESGKFKYGGWTAPYFRDADDEAAGFMQEWMKSTDILLGRKTYDIFEAYWPKHDDMWPGILDVTKYVASTTLENSKVDKSDWKHTVLLSNVDDIKKLKNEDGGEIKVHGSGNLAQTLFKHDLVDELHLMTFPITLGIGKRLFGDGTIATAFTLIESLVTSNGVIFANYKRAGEVKTGTVGA